MNKLSKAYSIFITICVVSAIILYKVHSDIINKDQSKTVLCTTTILADTVKNIVGNSYTVRPLMGPEIDPHTYKPTTQDVESIASANCIIYNGLHLEARMADIFKAIKNQCATFAAAEIVPKKELIESEEYENFFDPHVWFNPVLWCHVIDGITDFLAQHYPQDATLFYNNADHYKVKILDLYAQTKKSLNQIPKDKRILITTHDAFSYFAQAYHYQVISLQGINTATEAGGYDVDEIVQYIIKHQVPTLFCENSTPNKSLIAIAQYCKTEGLDVLLGKELCSDSLARAGHQADTYLGMLEYNCETIKQGLMH